MNLERNGRHIRLAYYRSFRRPVKIRVEPKPLRLADRIAPPLPAGVPFCIARPPLAPVPPRIRVIRLEGMLQPDWRVMGEQDLAFAEMGEVARS